ncbi:MAG TPA: hypothetical protein VEF04_07530 [Blastocatellia bacterium]|nr:hypothetical protein [Blastocatellia bacterium]
MSLNSITAATITLVKGDDLQLHQESLALLSKQVFPTIISDGGSGEDFISFLKTFPKLSLYQTNRGVFVQVRNSLKQAKQQGAKYILYTEPDKKLFFEQRLDEFLRLAPMTDDMGIVIASRTTQSFATFPASQQRTESFTNELCAQLVGLECDFCYGPLLIHHRLLSYLDLLDDSIGWGWRFFLFGIAHRLGLRLINIDLDLPCPAEQQDDSRTELIHRMNQLHQNVRGLVLSTSIALQ